MLYYYWFDLQCHHLFLLCYFLSLYQHLVQLFQHYFLLQLWIEVFLEWLSENKVLKMLVRNQNQYIIAYWFKLLSHLEWLARIQGFKELLYHTVSKLFWSSRIASLNIAKSINVIMQAVNIPKPCMAKTALIIAP